MAFAMGIRYLTGYSVAALRPDGDPEWPPHPGRIFMALASAHFETGSDPQERAALNWLESAVNGEPALFASDIDRRTLVTCYVPVNDRPIGKNPGLLQSVSGWARSKQPRTFSRLRPHDERVFLVWQERECPSHHRDALDQLCGKVTRIGHSSSLVQMWVADPEDVPQPNWIPDDIAATQNVRKISPGLLEYLEEQFGEGPRKEYRMLALRIRALEAERKTLKGPGRKQRMADLQEKIEELRTELPSEPPRQPLRPTIGVWQGYKRPDPKVDGDLPGTIWDSRLIVLRLEPDETRFPRLDLTVTLRLTARMHQSVIQKADEFSSGNVPEFICGHRKDGSPSERPHLAYLPLAFVGRPHADGHLMGLGVALPQVLDPNQRRLAFSAVTTVEKLLLGRLGEWQLIAETSEIPPHNLRTETWTAPQAGAREWATVTPVAFDYHPKTKDRVANCREVATMIRNACRRIGLPEPREVVMTPVSAHLGVPAAHEFPALKRKDGSRRQHAHSLLIFDEPVRGPIAVCAGRYRGYGFCRPLRES